MRFRQYTDIDNREAAPALGAEKILETAKTMFLEKGYKKTTVRDIASQAGVTQGLITYHFKSKENLARCVYIELIQQIFNQAATQLSTEDGMSSAEKIYISYIIGWNKLEEDIPAARFTYDLITETDIVDRISGALQEMIRSLIIEELLQVTEKDLALSIALLLGGQKMLVKLHYEHPERVTCQDIADALCSNLFYNLGLSDRRIAQVVQNGLDYVRTNSPSE